MKHLARFIARQIVNWLARQYHRLKLSNPALYTSIGAALLWLQMQLTDPAFLAMITGAIPPQLAFLTPVIQILPTLIGLILSPHTSERVKASREAREARKLATQSTKDGK